MTNALTRVTQEPVNVTEFEPGDLAMLERVVPLHERLDTKLPPLERHETLCELAALYFTLSTRMAGKGWDIVFEIERTGTWKLETKLDEQGHKVPKYSRFIFWLGDFFAPIHKMSKATTERRLRAARFLIQDLGIHPELAASVLDDKPALVDRVMDSCVFDEFSGQMVGLSDDAREGLRKELGFTVGEVASDRDMAREFVERMEAAEHHEASSMVGRAVEPLGIWFEWDASHKELILNGRARIPGNTPIQAFKYVFVLKHPRQHMHKAAWEWLMGKFRKPREQGVREIEEADDE